MGYNEERPSYEGGGGQTRREDDASMNREIVCTPVFVFLFLEHLMILDFMVVNNIIMF